MELVAALNRPAIRVIPVLVHDTQMPTPDQLPPDLQALARRNAVEVRTRNFNTDISRLIARMTEALTQADEARVRGDSAQAALAAAAIDETERAEFIRAEYDEQLRRQAWHRIDEDVLRYRRRYSWRTMYGMLSHSVWLNPARGDIRDLGSVERRCRNLIVRVRSPLQQSRIRSTAGRLSEHIEPLFCFR